MISEIVIVICTPTKGREETNRLDHSVTDNIKNKDKFNDAIDYEPKFDNKFILSIRLPMETLQVVTVSLREGNKNRATMIDIITLLWDNRDNGSIIKRKYTKPYGHILLSNQFD